ncbi:hypothetical protein NPIL_658591 [Nephila pilipes]|uniref:Uncharacterized protein n=1 Tax=Nephila pilipes TaxID=299642 RepID=A0A8X6P145_NEPPI|nr:hypothetical protein NPIL_658591 [Nephila pilipes]
MAHLNSNHHIATETENTTHFRLLIHSLVITFPAEPLSSPEIFFTKELSAPVTILQHYRRSSEEEISPELEWLSLDGYSKEDY